MFPGKYLNMHMAKGATFQASFIWKIDGVAIDLSTYTARMKVKKNWSSATSLLELTTENSRIDLNAETGRIDLVVDATTTSGLTLAGPLGDYGEEIFKYDLELVDAGGVVTRLLQGDMIIFEEITD